jgi:hypothetical protein
MNDNFNNLVKYLKSEDFKNKFREKVEKDTWGNDLPMIYLDDVGNIVEHYKDGTIKIIKEKNEIK